MEDKCYNGWQKTLPYCLAKRQEMLNRLLRVIADIKSEGEEAAISALVEYTGLSCSTFAKSHIWELLSEYGYASDNGNTKT